MAPVTAGRARQLSPCPSELVIRWRGLEPRPSSLEAWLPTWFNQPTRGELGVAWGYSSLAPFSSVNARSTQDRRPPPRAGPAPTQDKTPSQQAQGQGRPVSEGSAPSPMPVTPLRPRHRQGSQAGRWPTPARTCTGPRATRLPRGIPREARLLRPGRLRGAPGRETCVSQPHAELSTEPRLWPARDTAPHGGNSLCPPKATEGALSLSTFPSSQPLQKAERTPPRGSTPPQGVGQGQSQPQGPSEADFAPEGAPVSQERAGHTQTPPTGGQGYMVGGAWQGQGEGAHAQVLVALPGPVPPVRPQLPHL